MAWVTGAHVVLAHVAHAPNVNLLRRRVGQLLEENKATEERAKGGVK